MHDLEEDIKEKVSKSELLDDAANEIILADDDEPIRCVLRSSRWASEECNGGEKMQGRPRDAVSHCSIYRRW